MRRRNMIVNMKPIPENEPIFGRVDVSNELPMKSGSNEGNPFALEELAHKIGEFLCDKDKKTGSVSTRRIHKKHRKARSSSQVGILNSKTILKMKYEYLH